MTGQPSSRSSSNGAAQTIASAGDRARAFGQARRHSHVVRLMKFILPLVTVGSLGVYGAVLFITNKANKIPGLDLGKVHIDPKNLTMETPKYNGFGKDGSHYVVRAKEAISDLKQTGPIRLNVIDGDITQMTGVTTHLKATWGTYDQKKDVLELYEKVDVDGSTGMKARLTRATVYPKESRIVSDQPVFVSNETGEIRSRQMVFNSKERKGTFTEAVHVKLKANQSAKGAAGEQAAKPKSQSPMPGFAANSGQPIEVRSERLDFDDSAKTALFRKDVIAHQGDANLQAPELDVFYEGKAAMDGSKSKDVGAAGAAASSEPQTKLKMIKARGGVVMTNKDDRATSDTLDYDAVNDRALLKGNVTMNAANERSVTGSEALLDQKLDTALITGNVVVTQAKNVMKGQRLYVDRKAGTTRLESPAAGGQPAGRINTVFYQNQNETKAKTPGESEAKAAATKAAADAVPASPFTGFKTDPNEPIVIDADTMDVADLKRIAVFNGRVYAKQGGFLVETTKLTAHYLGQAGIASGTPGSSAVKAKAAKGDPGGAAQLTRVEARDKVIVTGKDGQKAVGDWADFDVKANTVTIGGTEVTVSQGPADKRSVINGKGALFIIDMTTGISRFERPPGEAVAKVVPSVSAAPSTTDGGIDPAQGTRPRMQGVFFPQAKDTQKQGDSTKKTKDAKEPQAPGNKTGASSWDATTSPGGKP